MMGRHSTPTRFAAIAGIPRRAWEHVTYGLGFTLPASLLVAANGCAAAVVLFLR